MANVSELGDVAGRADGHAIPLVEAALCNGLRAHAADEMFRVPGLAQGSQNLWRNKQIYISITKCSSSSECSEIEIGISHPPQLLWEELIENQPIYSPSTTTCFLIKNIIKHPSVLFIGL